MGDEQQINKSEQKEEQQNQQNKQKEPDQQNDADNNKQEKQQKAQQRQNSQQAVHKDAEEDQEKLKASKINQSRTVAKQELWKPYDFLFPGGKLAKLIKVNNIYKKNLPIQEMLEKFKFIEHTPVINIIGAMEKGRGKFYAGITRAAFNTDAVIIDNGVGSGIEKFALRRGVKLIGVAPEGQIKFPRINPTQVQLNQLANGHTHLFLVNNPTKDLRWGGEMSFKVDVAIKIAQGKKRPKGVKRCKIVSIIMGDATFDVIDEIKLCVQNDIPLIVVPGSPVCDQLIKCSEGQGSNSDLIDLVKQGHLFYCNSTNSQDIAQLTHLLLTITPW